MESISKEDLIIDIHHLGGIGNCGPIEDLKVLGNRSRWTIYDADPDALLSLSDKPNSILVNECIGFEDGKLPFHISANPSASSCLEVDDNAKNLYFRATNWGEHAKQVKTIEIKTSKLDGLIEDKCVYPIDVLSVDVQGLEWDILECTNLQDVLMVVTEAEFIPLYKDQKLFPDIHKLLTERGFILLDVFNSQYFSPVPEEKGCLTVIEPMYIKNPEVLFRNLDKNKVIKLTKLASLLIALGREEWGKSIMDRLAASGVQLGKYITDEYFVKIKT